MHRVVFACLVLTLMAQSSYAYERTNEYWDNSGSACSPSSAHGNCISHDECVACDGTCFLPNAYNSYFSGGNWVCTQGKWDKCDSQSQGVNRGEWICNNGYWIKNEMQVTEGRILDWITIKRKDIELFGPGDKYGHYWIEILDGPDGNPKESYGWWPKEQFNKDLVGAFNTFAGVTGELNGQTNYRGTLTRDPYHGKPAPIEFHPLLMNSMTDAQVLDAIHAFVRNYQGEWRWTFGYGQNCQTFQKSLMESVGLKEPI